MSETTMFLDELLRYQSYVSVITWIVGILSSFAGGVYITKFIRWWHGRCTQRILDIRDEKCTIVAPVRTNCSSDGNPEYMFNAITEGEAKQLIPLVHLLSKLSHRTSEQLSLKSPNEVMMHENSSWVLLGGPFANNAVFRLLSPEGLFGFRFSKAPIRFSRALLGQREIEAAQAANLLSDCNELSLEYGAEQVPFTNSSGYIILIKLKRHNERGSVHVVAGFTLANTINAISTLQSQWLYKQLKRKKHLDQYFLIIKCDSAGCPLLSSDGIIDITDVAFS